MTVATAITAGDVNGDGKMDVVVFGNANTFQNGPLASVLLGNGDGTFQPAVTYPSGGSSGKNGVLADVNGDGKLDIVWAICGSQFDCSGTGLVSVMLGNGDGTFQPAALYTAGLVGQTSVAVADVNGDGKVDLLVAGPVCSNPNFCKDLAGISVLLGNGDGTFRAAVSYFSSSTATAANGVAVADLNRDGKADLVAGNSDGTIGILLGNGDGTFRSAVMYGSGGSDVGSVTTADVNKDGLLDLVVANFYSGTVGVLLGRGDGTFHTAVAYVSAVPSYPTFQALVADINGDHDLDIVAPTAGVGVLHGNGDGTFAPVVTYETGYGGLWAVVTDLNGDGRPDIATVNVYGVGVLLNNSGAPTSTTAVSSSVNPLIINQTVTYTAAVTPPPGASLTGSVEFLDVFLGNTYVVGTALLQGNKASVSTSYDYIGPHTITALYSGDLNVAAGSVSSALIENVVDSSKTTVTTSGSPSTPGQQVTFTAKVSSPYGSIPNGELVTFYDGANPLGTVALSGGVAAYMTSSLLPGVHTIKASYSGDATFAASSGMVAQKVLGYSTTTAFATSLNPAIFGQAVTWNATVTTSGPFPPTGTVTFKGGGYSFGPATLNSSGVATLTKHPNAATYPLAAVYNGDTNNLTSSSSVINQVVEQATSSTTLASSPNPSTQGEAVTFTATVSSPTATPTGTVTFTTGNTVLGTVTLSSRKAKLTTSTLPPGANTVTATYNGNANFIGSSASQVQTVQ